MNNAQEKRAKLFAFRHLLTDFIRITGVPGLLWFRPKRIYASRDAKRKIRGGALLIANHIGFLDPAFLMLTVWYRRHRFICSEELMDSGAGKFLKAVGCIRIDRSNPTLQSFHTITDSLKNGELVSMFPEGRIQSAQSGSPFKSGMVLMAIRSGVPIIPVYLQPRSHWYSRLRVVIGERVSVKELYGDRPTFAQIDEATRLLKDREEQLKNFL